jgi:RHS repeat-associated protein
MRPFVLGMATLMVAASGLPAAQTTQSPTPVPASAIPDTCNVIGSDTPTSYCIAPKQRYWTVLRPSSSGLDVKYTGNYSQVASLELANLVEQSPGYCGPDGSGCTIDAMPGNDPVKWSHTHFQFNPVSGYAPGSGDTDASALCARNWISTFQWDAQHASYLSACSGGLMDFFSHQAYTPDVTNVEGFAFGRDGFYLGGANHTEDEVDFANKSPYPIVWSRHYSARTKQWSFNYDRHVLLSTDIAGQGAALNAFTVVLQRQDGQTYAFKGTKTNHVWTWVADLRESQWDDPTAAPAPPILGKLTSSEDLTSFSFKNHLGETESYDANGRLVSMQDRRNLPLQFSYDSQGRLSSIADASSRRLDVTYSSDVPADPNALLTEAEFMDLYPDNVSDYPSRVSDGSGQFATNYEFVRNQDIPGEFPMPASFRDPVVLGAVYDDSFSSAAFYNYDSQSNLVSKMDGYGNLVNQYDYSDFNVSGVSVTHGTQPGTTQYGWSGVITPTGHLSFLESDSTSVKITSQSAPCPLCIGPEKANIQYDAAQNPIRLVDFNGHVQTRTYDTARGLPLTITDNPGTPDERTRTFTWNPQFDRPLSIIEPVTTTDGRQTRATTFSYDANGNMTDWGQAVSGPAASGRSRFGYARNFNTFGQPATVYDANHSPTNYTYDSLGNLLTVTDALGHVTTLGNYDAAGNAGFITDPNGLTVSLTRDSQQRITSISRGCDPATGNSDCHWETTSFYWTPFGKISWVAAPSGQSLSYQYDDAERLVSIQARGQAGNVLGSTAIDQTESSQPSKLRFLDSDGTAVETETFDYDELNHLTQTVAGYGFQSSFVRDPEGNLASITDGLSHVTTREFDGLNQLVKTTLPDQTTIELSRGIDGPVNSLKDPAGNVTRWVWTGFGEVASRQSPDTGLTTYQYDFNHNVLIEGNASGRSTHNTFDSLNRMMVQTVNSGEELDFTYDNCPNGIGRLCSVTSPTGVTSFDYDLWGRVTRKGFVASGPDSFTTESRYQYTPEGNIAYIHMPSGETVSNFSENDHIPQISVGTSLLLSNATYDQFQRLGGWQWADGRQVRIDRDNNGYLRTVTTGDDAIDYIRDPSGLIGSIGRTHAGDDYHGTGLAYSNRGFLFSFGQSGAGGQSGSFTYDDNGNRTQSYGPLGPLSVAIQPGSNRVASIGGTPASTDLTGNLTQMPGLTLVFDDWNHLRRASQGAFQTSYGFDGLGERVSKSKTNLITSVTAPKVWFHHDPKGRLLSIFEGQNGTGHYVAEFVYLGDRPVGMEVNHVLYRIETDIRAQPIRVLDPAGTVVWSYENAELFGASDPTETTVNGQPFVLDLRLPDQYFDAESGLVHDGERDFSPTLGRYLQADPEGLANGTNPYLLSNNDPLAPRHEKPSQAHRVHTELALPSPGTPTVKALTAGYREASDLPMLNPGEELAVVAGFRSSTFDMPSVAPVAPGNAPEEEAHAVSKAGEPGFRQSPAVKDAVGRIYHQASPGHPGNPALPSFVDDLLP